MHFQREPGVGFFHINASAEGTWSAALGHGLHFKCSYNVFPLWKSIQTKLTTAMLHGCCSAQTSRPEHS